MLAGWFLDAPLTRALVAMPFDVADAGRLDRLADAEGRVAQFERRVVEARQTAQAAALLIERLRTGQEAPSGSELDVAVEVLLATERNLTEIRGRIQSRARENEAQAAGRAPQLLPLFQRMTALIDEELVTYLEAARDVRWEALAVQADREPAVESAALSTADDVAAFFRSLPPAA